MQRRRGAEKVSDTDRRHLEEDKGKSRFPTRKCYIGIVMHISFPRSRLSTRKFALDWNNDPRWDGMTDTLARNNQYSAGMMIAESLKAGDDAAPLSNLTSDVS